MIMFGSAAEGRKSPLSLDVSDIRELLSSIRPKVEENSDDFRAAVLLLAGPTLGFNIDRLARRTRIDRQFVAVCTRRLFDNGVWLHDGPVYAWQEPTDERFWRDVCVAAGRCYRRVGANGEIEWGTLNEWRKKYDFGQDADASLATAYITEAELPVATAAEPEIEEPISFQRFADAPMNTELVVVPAAPVVVEIATPAAAVVTERPAARSMPMAAAALHDSMMELFPGTQWL